ncbi:hypothetical protein Hanom_Chr16g01468681 [Helianthus anomalus]
MNNRFVEMSVSPGAPQYSNIHRYHGDHNNYEHRRTHGATWDATNMYDRR